MEAQEELFIFKKNNIFIVTTGTWWKVELWHFLPITIQSRTYLIILIVKKFYQAVTFYYARIRYEYVREKKQANLK